MQSFIQRFGGHIGGVLHGFDRLRFRATRRLLSHVPGMMKFLFLLQVPLKEFKDYSLQVTTQLKQRTEQDLQQAGRPLIYLPRSSTNKEERARALARQDGITQGTICVFSALEPAPSYQIRKDPSRGRLVLQRSFPKCLHYYHYFLDPEVGFGHVRVQTWFPFAVHLCLNGREWLACQMDQAGLGYVRQDNCFTELADFARTQALMDEQLRVHWPSLLDRLARPALAGLETLFADTIMPPYWSLEQSEWASDIVFDSAAELARWYPVWLRHGLLRLSSKDVMRFLGKHMPRQEGRYWSFEGQAITDLLSRPEGVRVKHRVAGNSIKMYDKQGVVLRVETTLNNPRDLKVYRPKEGDEEGELAWRRMRKGVADIHRRAQVCQAANERYVASLATVEEPQALGALAAGVCQPVRCQGRSVRALNPLSEADGKLLRIVHRGEFLINGFRNADVRVALYGEAGSDEQRRRQSAAVTRQLRLLRAHGLIGKVSKTHRYMISDHGRAVIGALLTAADADVKSLAQAA